MDIHEILTQYLPRPSDRMTAEAEPRVHKQLLQVLREHEEDPDVSKADE
jgi:hypothetical protein